MSWTDGDDRIEVELKRSPKSWAEVELPAMQKTIKDQSAEIDRLRGLLQRWEDIGPTLEDQPFDEEINVSPELERLIAETTEALK